MDGSALMEGSSETDGLELGDEDGTVDGAAEAEIVAD